MPIAAACKSAEDWAAHIARVAREFAGKPWRAVEAQHVIITARLVDTQDEQALLEDIIDAAKPPLATPPAGLHWLLFTPFRYPPLPRGSRFRAAGEPGVWYGADERATACAELGYWRWRFLLASDALESLPAQPQTLFQSQVRGRSIDLRRGRFAERAAQWTAHSDYSHCHALTRHARGVGIAIIRYRSVRDPEHRGCVALLNWGAFSRKTPLAGETWLLDVTRERALWVSANMLAPAQFEFSARAWREKN